MPKAIRLFWLLFSLTIIAIAIRLLAPHRLAMYFMGYAMVDLADTLYTVPKYGPGGQVLHHLLFMLTGVSHDAVMHLNSVIGGLIVFTGSASLLALGSSAIESLGMGVLLAFTPLFIRDQTSESLLVPTLLWLFLGIALLWFRGAVWHKVMGISFVLLACFSRAETPFLVPLCLEGRLESDAFVLIGVRCYMRPCTEDGIHPACERAMRMQGLVSLVEKVVPVHRPEIIEPIAWQRREDQDLDFPHCVPFDEMKLGLYKVSKAN